MSNGFFTVNFNLVNKGRCKSMCLFCAGDGNWLYAILVLSVYAVC